MQVRDSGRRLLAQGVTLQDLRCYGRVDYELLFQDQAPCDAMNILNWTCEVKLLLSTALMEYNTYLLPVTYLHTLT